MMCPDGATKLLTGEAVFPASGFSQGFSQQTSIALQQHPEVGRVWLLGCAVYHDGDKTVHHTWFWLRSTHPDGTGWIVKSPTFRYMPIVGFESWGEEVD